MKKESSVNLLESLEGIADAEANDIKRNKIKHYNI